MSRFAPPRADPHGLREAARRLTEVGRDLEARGTRIAATGTATLDAWQGSASLLMVARARELQRVTQQQEQALGAMAAAADRYADEVERAGSEVRRLNELWDEAVRRSSLQAVDDGSTVLAQTQAELEQRYVRMSAELEEDGFSLQRALSSRDPVTFLPSWLAGGAYAAQAIFRTATTSAKAAKLVRYSVLLRQVSRFYDLGHVKVAAAVLDSAEYRALMQALHGKTSRVPVAGRALTAAGRAFLPLTAMSGIGDVISGGGYDGWRDPVTRVAGAAGAGGAVLLMVSTTPYLVTLGPVGAAIAGAAVLAYGAWIIGSFVYDHRQAIGEFLGRARDGVVRAATATTQAAGRAVTQAKDAVLTGVGRAAGAAVDTGRTVLDVVTSPTQLLPKVAGLF